jgi:hypothetical protein
MTDFEIDTTGGDVEPGTYLATLVAWEPFALYELADGSWSREDPLDGTEPQQRITWRFALEDGSEVEGVTSTSYRSPLAKLRQWCIGLGIDMAKPQKLTADTMLGREGMVTVELSAKGYSRVAQVNPLPKKLGK